MFIYFIGFVLLVIGLLALDLGVFHRSDKVLSARSALLWTFFWVAIAVIFGVFIYVIYDHHWLGIGFSDNSPKTGADAAIAYFTAYIIEKSLSIDNIFVIAVIFEYFRVPPKYQHRVLFWGIIGVLLMRGIMIIVGINAIARWEFITYILGAFLILTSIRMMIIQQDKLKPEKNFILRTVNKIMPVTHQFYGHSFLVKINGRITATPLFLALLLIESTDLFFAIDSIPAVLAITLDPFIVFTSNIFAILGMRSLYFALASLMDRFRYLKQSLIFILAFVGVKMILAHYVKIDALLSLWVIVGILIIGGLASLLSAFEEKILLEDKKRSLLFYVFLTIALITVLGVGILMVIYPTLSFIMMAAGIFAIGLLFVFVKILIKKLY